MRAVLVAIAFGLVAGSAAGQTPEARLPACLACHGATGMSKMAGTPSLGGQSADYVLIQLYQFREKQRKVPVMIAMAAGLTDDDLQTMADLVAKLPAPVPSGETLDAAALAHGQALVAQYRCGSCHNPDFSGHDQMPHLAGQREDYLLKSLTEYKSNARAGYDPAMNEVAQEVKAEDIPALAKYLSQYK